MENATHHFEFLRSAISHEGTQITTEEVKEWVKERREATQVTVTLIPFAKMDKWQMNEETGNLVHSSGGFFSIEGINASTYSNLQLNFGYRKESASALPTFSVDYWNGTSWVTVANTLGTLFNEAANATSNWYLSKTLSLPAGAQINGLKIRFVNQQVLDPNVFLYLILSLHKVSILGLNGCR
jgi:hypothetical protein